MDPLMSPSSTLPHFLTPPLTRDRRRALNLPIISQSNTHLVWNGMEITVSKSPLSSTRNSFDPHCVSYTPNPSVMDANVANTRPR